MLEGLLYCCESDRRSLTKIKRVRLSLPDTRRCCSFLCAYSSGQHTMMFKTSRMARFQAVSLAVNLNLLVHTKQWATTTPVIPEPCVTQRALAIACQVSQYNFFAGLQTLADSPWYRVAIMPRLQAITRG